MMRDMPLPGRFADYRVNLEQAREDGARWNQVTEQELVGLVGYHGEPIIRDGAAAELQRRLLAAIRDFNGQSSRQAKVMIWLTVAIVVLTAVMVWVPLGMLFLAIQRG
jgi:hypothetical protein